ncbi:GlxA family transcriptional regulator [Tsukamurella paurometabola]|uniref:Chb operon repressor n=1 Tax=Tsukamurella paurometabola TaxID=2061 RepID=A0A3P8LFA1_TSUPA|nr:DJ-1/PfpI family protein [Tsukamurella paurometabola]UEA82477.1 DJ-1/PfpI family protein [Tsukamurella paurometabola]VDR39532.1 Chb operon repressor [Tsukamurella paurometabola]
MAPTEARVHRDVVVPVRDGVTLIDVAGPVQALSDAGGYRVRIASHDGGPVTTDARVPLVADCAWAELADDPVDTLLVPGYPPGGLAGVDAEFLAVVGRIAAGARRVVSVCTGAYVLAAAGLLDGRRATSHWQALPQLAARFPAVAWEPDAIYVRDGPVITSAGATAGIDLALALIGEDQGEERARAVARYLVVFLQRPGGQQQYGAPEPGGSLHPLVRAATERMAHDPAADHHPAALAAALSVSERHLARLFRRELGRSPGRHLEHVRVRAAQRLLERPETTVPEVAAAAGFGTPEAMRRAFHRVLGISPSAYRHRFRL